jgi:hypothetical protein
MTEESTEPSYEWDFFLAHPGADLDAAKNLYAKLNPPAKVFLDDECLLPGDTWDIELPIAQRSSLISIILVTPNTENAYYQRDEIAAAIQMSRADPRTHRVIPIYLNKNQIPKNLPYGLTLKHSLYVPETGDLTETRELLLKTLESMKKSEAKKEQVVKQQQIAIAKITGDNSSKAEIFAGFAEITKFIRPLLNMLIGLFVLTMVLLIVSLWLFKEQPEIRIILILIFGILAALLLISILWLILYSLNYARQIAQGRINGG